MSLLCMSLFKFTVDISVNNVCKLEYLNLLAHDYGPKHTPQSIQNPYLIMDVVREFLESSTIQF